MFTIAALIGLSLAGAAAALVYWLFKDEAKSHYPDEADAPGRPFSEIPRRAR